MKTLGDFIAEELRRRDISARQFADLVGVSHTTITKTMYKNAPEPSLDFLAKLARTTGIDLCTLVAMVYPNESRRSAEVDLIAQRIARLPPEHRSVVDSYLLGGSFKPEQ